MMIRFVLLLTFFIDHVVAQPGVWDVCHICPGGDHGMSCPGCILNTHLSSYSCSEARNYGLTNQLGDASCLIFQMYANMAGGGCGCNTPVTFPVDNPNDICNICPDNQTGLPASKKDVYVNTIMGYMTCGQIDNYGASQFIPSGYCQYFVDDARQACCTEDKAPPAPEVTPSPTTKPTPLPTKPPTRPPTRSPTKPPTRPPTRPPTKSPTKPPTKPPTRPPTKNPTASPTPLPTPPLTKCQNPSTGCSSNNPCCIGYTCNDDETCVINNPPEKLGTKQKASLQGNNAWD